MRDATERQEAERTLHDLRVAEAADRVKSAFLATMSHELRTRLNSILGFTGVILKGLAGPVNAGQASQLGMVRGSARHLLELINDVLDLSKIDAGQGEVHAERSTWYLRSKHGRDLTHVTTPDLTLAEAARQVRSARYQALERLWLQDGGAISDMVSHTGRRWWAWDLVRSSGVDIVTDTKSTPARSASDGSLNIERNHVNRLNELEKHIPERIHVCRTRIPVTP